MAGYAVSLIVVCCFVALLAPVLVLTCGCRKKQLRRPELQRRPIWHGRTYNDVEGGQLSGTGGAKDGDMVVVAGAGALIASTAVLASLDDTGCGGHAGANGGGHTGSSTCGGGGGCGGG